MVFRTEPGQEIELVDEWIHRPALRRLVEMDGGTWPTGTLDEIVAGLGAFSSIWDRRNGQSRLVFKDETESRDDERAEFIYASAKELGLLRPGPPTLTEPEYLLILGGLATGVEPRVLHSAELLSQGVVMTDCVAALTSFRPLHEREFPAAQHYAPEAKYEIDLLTAMLDQIFTGHGQWTETLTGDPSADPYRAEDRRERSGHPRLITYAARSGDPKNRAANTADTYIQFAADNQLHDGQTVLIVTSAIYVPFQHMDAVRVLGPFRVAIESIGVPSSSSRTSHPPSAYLQEVRSCLRSAQALLQTRRPVDPDGGKTAQTSE